jgi:hypothetical protein
MHCTLGTNEWTSFSEPPTGKNMCCDDESTVKVPSAFGRRTCVWNRFMFSRLGSVCGWILPLMRTSRICPETGAWCEFFGLTLNVR